MHRLVVVVGLMLLFLRFNATPAFACSGGETTPTPLEVLIPRSVLVRATIIESSAGNHMLAIEQYLIGSGPQILFLYRESPVEWTLHRVRGYDVGCSWMDDGDLAPLGSTTYIALQRQESGAYRADFMGNGEEVFSTWDDEITYWTMVDPDGDPSDYDNLESHTVSQAEFVALVEEMSGQEASPPDRFAPIPRRKLLYITTESGQRYMLPVDGGEVVPLLEPPCGSNCPILSPDGTHMAQLVDQDHIQFIYPGVLAGNTWENQREIIVEGQEVLFSPNSDAELVWDDNHLNAYHFFVDTERYGMNGQYMNAAPIWSVELATDERLPVEALRGTMVWSGDSTTVAYVDAAGIWQYDFFQQTEPQLIVPFEELGPSLDIFELSRTGRYLRYGTLDGWTLVDGQTGATYDDGLISPEERYLALFHSSEIRAPVAPREDTAECYVPVRAECGISVTMDEEFELAYSAWIDANSLLVFYCFVDNHSRCDAEQINLDRPYDVDLPRSPEWGPQQFFPAYDVAYDPQYGKLALVSSDYTIQFDRYISHPLDIDETPDLSYVLDSPIVDIEWGESLWYDDGR